MFRNSLFALILLCVVPAHASIGTPTCQSSGNDSGSTTGTISITASAGDTLWAAATSNNGNGTSAISWTGFSPTLLDANQQSNFRLESDAQANVTGGSYSITASQSGGATAISAAVCDIPGIATTSILDGHTNSGNTPASAPPINSGSLTNTAANVIFMSAVSAFVPGGAFSVDSSFTIPTNGNVQFNYLAIGYKIVSSAAANNPSWSGNTSQFLYADIVSLKAASAPPPSCTPSMALMGVGACS